MFHGRNMAFKLIYNDSPNRSYNELLAKDKSVTIHQKNVELVATKNVKNRIASELMSTILQFPKKPSNLGNTSILHRKRTKTVYNDHNKLDLS